MLLVSQLDLVANRFGLLQSSDFILKMVPLALPQKQLVVPASAGTTSEGEA